VVGAVDTDDRCDVEAVISDCDDIRLTGGLEDEEMLIISDEKGLCCKVVRGEVEM